ncbi:MAG: ATP-binding cassette domain-containing protein [Actinomycetota bacterium]
MDAPVIKVSELTKRFDGFTAVDAVSFEVAAGELFGFIGPNGAGKTTTINMLVTLVRPSAGAASIAGYDVAAESGRVRESIGVVFQDPTLDNRLTGMENLDFHASVYHIPKQDRARRIAEALALVELTEQAGDIVDNYSGGMKRRLEVARGLLHTPKVLFLDEPTLGLDPQTRNRIWEYLRALAAKSGTTVFMTTHYMDEAENCDRVAIIDQGRIVALDTPAALKKFTGKNRMDDVFLELTGKEIREGFATPKKHMSDIAARAKGGR